MTNSFDTFNTSSADQISQQRALNQIVPFSERKKTLSVSFNPSTLEALKILQKKSNTSSRSATLEAILCDFFEQQIPEEYHQILDKCARGNQ